MPSPGNRVALTKPGCSPFNGSPRYLPRVGLFASSRRWPSGAIWTDAEEFESSQEGLYRLALGLSRRCRRKILIGLSELGESGYEHKGPFLVALQRLLKDRPQAVLPT